MRQCGSSGALPGERGDQAIGVGQARELQQLASLARQHAHRVAHPAQARVVQEAPDGGRAGHADVDRQMAAFGADHALPREQRLGLEHELSDQAGAGGGPPGIGELLLQRHRGCGRSQLALAFGVPCEADGADAARLEQAALEQRTGPGEGAAWPIDAATDHEHLIDPGIAGDAPQVVVELGAIDDRTRRKMRHRDQAFGADARRHRRLRCGGLRLARTRRRPGSPPAAGRQAPRASRRSPA